jgi:hypothetical protein
LPTAWLHAPLSFITAPNIVLTYGKCCKAPPQRCVLADDAIQARGTCLCRRHPTRRRCTTQANVRKGERRVDTAHEQARALVRTGTHARAHLENLRDDVDSD